MANVAHQRARIDVPEDGDFVAVQVKLYRCRRAPVRGNLGKLANNEGLDVRAPGLFVFKIGTDIPDVGIGKTDDLASVAGVGEDFLVTGEAGVENDLATAARDGARGAAVKDAAVFQREGRGSVRNLPQRILPWFS